MEGCLRVLLGFVLVFSVLFFVCLDKVSSSPSGQLSLVPLNFLSFVKGRENRLFVNGRSIQNKL